MSRQFLTILALALSLNSTTSFAGAACFDLISKWQSSAVREVVIEDAYQQWLLWEQKANLAKYEKPTEAIDVPLVEVSIDEVNLIASEQTPRELIDLFQTSSGSILWPKHPYNTHEKVPFLKLPSTASLPVYMTSSRSLALGGKFRGFTIKLATDHPHGPKGEYQPGKIETNDDVDSALLHTRHLEKVDREFGIDPKMVMLGEIMTLAEKSTGIGMVVRDIRPMTDGNYYLPALSIPYVGREIAKLNGAKFEEFFSENYAALLGEAKARLLLRTGLQMLTPNPQNMLIQFDRNLRPTGKLFFRDISDSYLVDVVAKGLGHEEQMALDTKVGYEPVTEIHPFWSNSAWRLDEAGEKSVPSKVLKEWGRAHNTAYVEFIKKELGLEIRVGKTNSEDMIQEVYEALKSDIGQAKLRQYKERMIRENQRVPKAS